MTATSKTNQLLRLDLPVTHIQKNEQNPNKMNEREFDLLVDNIEQTGLTDPILVRPENFSAVYDLSQSLKSEDLQEALKTAGHRFRIIGGHHRLEAAVYLGFEWVPCTVMMDPEFDGDRENFQLVRMNMIKGRMDPQRFVDLVNKLNSAYTTEVLQESFGFADEAEWHRMVDQASKTLPDKKTKAKFKEAAKEVKTIEGLSKLLNKMFNEHGDTLPYGYMVVDYGGQRSMWVRVEKKTMDALDLLGDRCIDDRVTLDDLLGGFIKSMAKGEHPEIMDALIEKAPKVPMPEGLPVTPTKDNLSKVGEL